MSPRLSLLVLALLLPAGARAQADAGAAHAGTAPQPREPAALSNLPITTKAPAAIPWFRLGQKKALNFELQAATEALHKALALDPDFAQALAWLGRCEADATGLAHLERAVALAQKLPETERLSVEALLAERRGDDETVRTLRRKLADLAPNDWLTQLQMGVQAFYDHKSQAAIVFLNRAVALRPELAEPYIYLGYTLALQGDSEAGVRAARRQVELQPDEPNAHDSLGEVLLLVDRVEEAEKAFLHAAELSSDPWMMWMGVAYCRFVRGDFKGAQAAVASGKKSTWRRSDEFATDLVAAWGHWLAGEPDEALAVLDAT
ncbi:MAG: hypothetical protein JST92_06205, partial [Deltaproteobacteria bacterium]|nr:hypothetical protein [Deltaproteobacteria bacterium]